MNNNPKTMRDALIEKIYERMFNNDKIFFVSADFGSPVLDKLRKDFKERFINVGIAEQNLINVSTGLALEGYIVYAYAIAPFLSMRCYEQIRINLSLMSQIRNLNVNMISVGAGLSYDVTGPTHHCFEDIPIIRVLPNIVVFSPSDHIMAEKFVEFSLNTNKPKYIRLDGKAQPSIYNNEKEIVIEKGFYELKNGKDVCIISTGYMTHKALKVVNILKEKNINAGHIDFFLLKTFDEKRLSEVMSKYKYIFTMEEGFIDKGGLDSLISNILRRNKFSSELNAFGFGDGYVFEVGDREYLHKINNLDEESIIETITKIME
ncbi:MAG: transketolase C-terminal domain-containing protein [bacterium]